jgi:tyrosinase
MGSNGEYIPHEGITLVPKFPGLPDTPLYLEPGLGGGCIKSGPFKDYVVNLGPLGMDTVPTGPEGGLGYNPRCMKRDVGPAVTLKYTTYPLVLGKYTLFIVEALC